MTDMKKPTKEEIIGDMDKPFDAVIDAIMEIRKYEAAKRAKEQTVGNLKATEDLSEKSLEELVDKIWDHSSTDPMFSGMGLHKMIHDEAEGRIRTETIALESVYEVDPEKEDS